MQVRRWAVGMCAVAGLALAGCGGGSSHVASAKGSTTTSSTLAPSTTTTTEATTTTSTAPATSSTTATTTSTGGGASPTPTCQHLTTSSGEGQGATGHFSKIILFRNSGTTTCEVYGYPGIDGVLSGGQHVAATRSLSGFTGGVRSQTSPPIVTLQPGAEASADLEGTDVPEGNATSCPSFTGLLVTPPNTTATVSLSFGAEDCSGLEIHPVVSGTTGDD